ncbi:H(+)-transporting V1 sector ATPase subunit H [Entomophthora muscae]|uniref:H(+)-transporting V1 sector ATPase subunit H n=1 Tax=Entomophthora muscae TaxID=34485 RepID=A0ACC2ST38_9FUNG|nr:H(+)-transporting V1 sector ATPase subunit H [Entomophthora muscae]
MTADVPSVPVTLVVNSFFEELTASTRSRPMPWEGYQRASLITEEELSLLRQYANTTEVSPEYIHLLVNLLNKLVRVDTLQYILVLIDDLLEADPNAGKVLHEMKRINASFPYEPFLKCLKKDDEFLALKAEKIITFLICTGSGKLPSQGPEFLDILIVQLSSRTTNVADITVQLFQSLLRTPRCRIGLFHKARGIPNLVSLIGKERSNPQMLYQIIFCFWLMSFEAEIAEEFDIQHNIIPLLIEIAKTTGKEKLIRVIVGTFKNLLEKAAESNISVMIGHKLYEFVDALSSRKWNDTEIQEDLEFLKTELQNIVAGMTTFDAYKSEVESGLLEWSPPHKSAQFWKQNATKLEDNDNALLELLTEFLKTSTSATVLSIAAHDIGQYVKYSPKGKQLVEKIGAKHRIMELMTHSNSDVKYQALKAVQNFLMYTWDKI